MVPMKRFVLVILYFISLVAAAPKIGPHHHRSLQQNLIIFEDTVWDEPGDDDLLLVDGEGIVVFSNATLTIRGRPDQPIRIYFNSSGSSLDGYTPPPPKIELYPFGTLIMEHVDFRHLSQSTAKGYAGIIMDHDSTLHMSHVHCSNMKSCVSGGKLVVRDSVFRGHAYDVFISPIQTNITSSLFVNNGAVTHGTGNQKNLYIWDSIFLNNSRVFTGPRWIENSWFLNNTLGVYVPKDTSIINCVFYGSEIAVNLGRETTRDKTHLTNLTFVDNGAAITSHSNQFAATRLNLLQSTYFHFASYTRDTIALPNLYWGLEPNDNDNLDLPTTLDIIQSTIFDVNTGNLNAGIVSIEPIATEPFPHSLLYAYDNDKEESGNEFPDAITLPYMFQGLPLSAYQEGNYTSMGNWTLPGRIEWEQPKPEGNCNCTCPQVEAPVKDDQDTGGTPSTAAEKRNHQHKD